jgi:thioester reductase-like protein
MGPVLAGQNIIETPVGNDPRSASGTGYAQSKYMVERITQYYASTLNMPVRLLRVGQLCGHSTLGVWNETEMWPIMIATGLDYLKAMPLFDESRSVNWLPVDACAMAVAAIITSPSGQRYAVNNLVHPKPITWIALLDLLAEASGEAFRRVKMSEWTAALEELAEGKSGDADVPGLKLLAFFQQMAATATLEHEKVNIMTESVIRVESLDITAVKKMLGKWRERGFVRLRQPGV